MCIRVCNIEYIFCLFFFISEFLVVLRIFVVYGFSLFFAVVNFISIIFILVITFYTICIMCTTAKVNE